ncbi:MAG: M14 family zinc carboxypeptidase, partial [Eubacteriales bacterium]|nr:M14 family zinc carboxypeptidase [Eubacteriales bacterium]
MMKGRVGALLCVVVLLCACQLRVEPPSAPGTDTAGGSSSAPQTLAPAPSPRPTQTAAPAGTPMLQLAEGAVCRVEVEEFLSLRISDSGEAVRIQKLPRDARVRVLAIHGAFARVQSAQGDRGYVMSQYLLPVDEALPEAVFAPGEYTVVCREYLSLFETPQVQAESIGILSAGSGVQVKGTAGDGFARVYAPDLGAEGFVLLSYLTPGRIANTQAKPTPAPGTPNLYRVSCNQYVTLRTAPSLRAQGIEQIEKDELVEVLGFDGLFARISYGSLKGYVLSGYLVDPAGLPHFSVIKPTASYSYDRMVQDIARLARDHPDELEVSSLGRSLQGRDIPLMILGPQNASQHVLVQGAIHGPEHMTALLMMAQVDDLLSRRALPRDTCLHIVPMSNPDGVTISQSAAMTGALRAVYRADLEQGYTQVGEAQYLSLWKANAAGVDLNRNFDADFGAEG